MDIDLMLRKWSLSFKYIKQFTQLGCIVDLITGLRTEPLTESGLKNLVCDIKPVTMSIKNYVITEVTANMTANVHLLSLPNQQKYGHFQRLLHQLEYEYLKLFICITQPTSVFYFRKMLEQQLALKILAIKTCKQPPVVETFQICL
ncbi:MAG: hypothetical protein EZS28_003150 [Streblomastix strix]|uniref:Uncharacterized protein n=1 Tax=Streblomastix strix TaxID=222440 RepID=A0A5J4X3J5_9EUKA|nr:MAG: hypothetical protein EZS28_003150 [Streblomastix strix]